MSRLIESYNQRLFSGGVRQLLHDMRFNWLREETKGMEGSVFELGCFDARSLAFLSFEPEHYLGVDAGWEGGIEAAIKRYPRYEFVRSQRPFQPQGTFDVAVSLETLEHLPRNELPAYINMLHAAAPTLLATVPVEIGPLFLVKHLMKVAMRSNEKYTVSEALLSTMGMTSNVEQDQHKGFDYRFLVKLLRSRYKNVVVRGLPFSLAPLLSFTVGIRAER